MFTLVLISLLAVSCSNDDGVNDSGIAVSLRETPEITGMFLTDETGPIVLGVWGVPSGPGKYLRSLEYDYYRKSGDSLDPHVIPRKYNLFVPYPNPFTEEVIVCFALPEASKCRVWVIRGYVRTQEEIPGATANEFGIETVRVSRSPGVVADRYYDAGEYIIKISFKENGNLLYPYGFYRVYLQAGDFFDWADICFTTENAFRQFRLRH